MILTKDFFEQPALFTAKSLLGKYLVRQRNGKNEACMIVDVEAYDGPMDKASHAHRGRTTRNAPMFGPAGVWYIYLCYGMHWMLNVVTGKEGYPAAVLIRGVQNEAGEKISGPGRVTKALGINSHWNNVAAVKLSALWIEDRGIIIGSKDILTMPRVGVAYAGDWAQKEYRFVLVK